MLQKTEGIVLRTQDYGETHKLVTILTKEIGKITAISRGASKPRSRLSAVSQLFIEAEYLLYIPQGLATLRQGDVISTYRHIRADLTRTAYAAYTIELTDRIIEERNADLYIYNELKTTMQWINDAEAYLIPVMMYEMKLFQKGGFAPVVDQCVNCRQSEGLVAFSVQEGGVLCDRCITIDRYAVRLSPSLLRMLSIFLHVELERVGNINVKKRNITLLRDLLDQYYDRYGGYKLKSKKFLKELKHLEQ